MKFEETISTVEDLVAFLTGYRDANPDDRLWFRGQRKSSWKLVPSLSREIDASKRIAAEGLYIKTFKQNASTYAPHPPSSEWDWLFLMQHYRAPTRLLDWSESPLVGLFFATETGPEGDEEDGALWCLWPRLLNREANIELELAGDLPFFELDRELDNYLPSAIAAGSLSELGPIAAGAQRRFQRLHSQLGVFTISHKTKQEIEPGDYVAKITIPTADKVKVRKQLELLGVNQFSMFPELENIGRLTREVPL